MIDHLLAFANEAAAQEALPELYRDGNWGPGVIFDVKIVLPDESVAPGFYIISAEREINTAYIDLPGDACRLITDREASNRGDPTFMLYVAPDMNPETLALARVEPTFAGSNYPFGAVP